MTDPIFVAARAGNHAMKLAAHPTNEASSTELAGGFNPAGWLRETTDKRAAAGLVAAAGVVVRTAVPVRRHLHQLSSGRTTGETAPRPGFPVLRPLIPAGAGGRPTPLASAGSNGQRGAA